MDRARTRSVTTLLAAPPMAYGLGKVPGGDPVLSKIDAIRRSVRAWTIGWGYLWTALLMAGLIFAGVLLDHIFALPRGGRLAFFRTFVLALAGAVSVATLFPFIKRMGRLYIARRMEAQRPELKNALISYLQCRDDPGTPDEIKRLLRQKALASVRSLGTSVVVDSSRFVRLSMAVGGVVLAFLLYGMVSPKSAAVSVERLLRPTADILAPTGTHVTTVEPGELYAVAGDEPRIRVVVEGVRPAAACVVWDGTTFQDSRILLTRKDEGRWEGSFPPILENGSYYVVAGDAPRERYGITVLPAPAVTELRLTLTPPAYTGLPARTVTDGNLDVPAGTAVSVHAVTNLPPQTGVVEFDSGRRVWLQPEEGQSALGGQFAAVRSDAYVVRFESVRYPNGATFKNLTPVKFTLTCREDQAPVVNLLGPEDGLKARASDKVAVTYSARDDYRIARVRLRYAVNDQVAQPFTVAEPVVAKVENATYEWDLSTTSALPGGVLTYYLEAEDNRPGLSQVGRSQTRRIYLVAPQAAGRPAPAAESARSAQGQAGAVPEQPEPANTPKPAAEAHGGPPPAQSAAQRDEAKRQEEQRALKDYARKVAEQLRQREEEQAASPPDRRPAAPAENKGAALQPPAQPVSENPAGQTPPAQPRPSPSAPEDKRPPEPPVPKDTSQHPVRTGPAPEYPEGRGGLLAPGEAKGQEAAGQADVGTRSPGDRPGREREADAGKQAQTPKPGGSAVGDQGSQQAKESEPGAPEAARAEAPAQPGSTAAAQQAGGKRAPSETAESLPPGGAAAAGETRPASSPATAAEAAAGAAQTGEREAGPTEGAAPAGSDWTAEGAATGQPGAAGLSASSAGSREGTGRSAGASGRAGAEGARQGQGAEASGGAVQPAAEQGAQGGATTGQPQGQGTRQGTGVAGEGTSDGGAPGGSAGRASPLAPQANGPVAPGGARGTGVRTLPPSGPREGPLSHRDLDTAVGELGRMIQENRLPPDLLQDLGTNREKLQDFVDRYRRERPAAPPNAGQPEAAEGTGQGAAEGRVEATKAAQEGVSARDALPTASDKDTLRNRFEGADERLSSRYREVVDRYYKVLSEER